MSKLYKKTSKRKLISLLTLSTLGLVVSSTISSTSSCLSIGYSSEMDSKLFNSNNSLDSSVFNGIQGTASTTNKVGNYEVTSQPTSTNLYANQITEKMIESVLTVSSQTPTPHLNGTISSFNVSILPVTEKNLSEGSVDFLICEVVKESSGTYKTQFATSSNNNGINIDSSILNQYKIENTSATNNNVFSTSMFSNLNSWILKKNYEIKWKTDAEIKDYILNKKTEGLTKEDVWNNLIDNSILPPLLESSSGQTPSTNIVVTEETSNGASGLGLYKIVITINGTQNTQPKNSSTKYLGGFLKSGKRNTFELSGNIDISNITITKEGLFNVGDQLSTSSTKLNQLTASEFVSPNGGNDVLMKILANGENLSINNSDKIIYLKYGNNTISFNNKSTTPKLQSTNAETPSNVGDAKNKTKIKKIDAIPNDSNGSLQLIVYYDCFDVYSGTIKETNSIFNFPKSTFKINPNANKDLFVTWKEVDSLKNMNYSYEVINEWYKNRNNEEFSRMFSNNFLETTKSVKELPRTVEIDYGAVGGVPVNNELTSNSDNTVRVKLTFDNWGSIGKAYTIENIYAFDGYKYGENEANKTDVLNFQWKSNSKVFEENKSFTELTPSTAALNLITEYGNSPTGLYNKFILGNASSASNVEVSLCPDDANGTLTVYARKKSDNGSATSANNHIYQQMYVGFKESNIESGITSFSFIPQSEVSEELLSIPIEDVTKQNVIDLYLKKIDIFNDNILTEDNVSITPINDDINPRLEVSVVIESFDQSRPDVTKEQQTFVTVISGFSKSTSNNLTKFDPPKDLTAIISIVSAVVFSVSLGVTFIALMVKRAGIKSFDNDLKEKDKKNKKRK